MRKINVNDVIFIHDYIIEKYGGLSGVKNLGALESSLNNAFQTFFGEDLYKTDIDKISNIFYLMIKNYCFEDANKRTSVSIFNVLVKANKIHIKYGITELEDLALNVADDEMDYDNIKEWTYNHLV